MPNFPTSNLGGSASPGRPARQKPLVLRAPEQSSGWEWATAGMQPEVITRVQQNYIKNQQMPPGLAPKMVTLPYGMELRRRRAISQGWRNPRGYT